MLESFVGHRATRLRGLLKTTHLVAPNTLACAAHELSQILPNFAFTSIGVLWHADILQHTDPMTSTKAAMITLVGSRCSLQVISPVSGKQVCIDTVHRVVVFNPQQPHAVFTDSSCLSLVVYQTRREVHKTQAIDLRALGFPVCATEMDLPTNFTDIDTDTQVDTDCELAQLVPSDASSSLVTCDANISTLGPAVVPQNDHSVCVSHEESGERVVISPTLPWECDAGCCCCCSKASVWSQLLAGTIENAELSKLSQKVKDLGVDFPMKTVRALITLDAKLRKFLRGEVKDSARIRDNIEACMKRWNMVVPEGGGASSSGGQRVSGTGGGSARQRARTQDVPRTQRGDDGEWKEVQQRKKKLSKKSESEPVITLCQTAWPVPVRQEADFKLDYPAVYQVNSKEALQHMALEAVHVGFPVMVVSPFRTTLGYAPPQQMVLPFVVCHGASRSKALLNVWVHQLSAEPIVPVSPPEAIEVNISGTESSSCILSADIDVFNFSHEDITEALEKSSKARQLVASLLPRVLAEEPLLDIFRLQRTSGRWMSALLRVKMSAVEEYLKLSGLGALWINTPRHLADDTRIIWLKEPGDPSSPMSLDGVRAKLTALHQPLGLVSKQSGRTWSYAVRVKTSTYKDAQSALSVDTKDTFFVQGVPTCVSESDLQSILDKLQWPARVVEGTRRVWKGKTSIAVKAGGPPAISYFTVRVDNRQVQLHVISRKSHARAATQPPKPSDDGAALQVEASTWTGALKGKYVKASNLDGGSGDALSYAQVAGADPPPFPNVSASLTPQSDPSRSSSSWQPRPQTQTPARQQGAYEEGHTRWWRGAQWQMVGSQWQKVETPSPQETPEPPTYNHHDEGMDVEETSRKRLTFLETPHDGHGGYVRATAKRRVSPTDAATVLQSRLHESRALLDVFKGVLASHGIECPQHASLGQDDDDEEDEIDDDFDQAFGLGADGDPDADMSEPNAHPSGWDGTGDAPDMDPHLLAGVLPSMFCLPGVFGHACVMSAVVGPIHAVMFKGLDPASWPHGVSYDAFDIEAEQAKQLCDNEVDESSSCSCPCPCSECCYGNLLAHDIHVWHAYEVCDCVCSGKDWIRHICELVLDPCPHVNVTLSFPLVANAHAVHWLMDDMTLECDCLVWYLSPYLPFGISVCGLRVDMWIHAISGILQSNAMFGGTQVLDGVGVLCDNACLYGFVTSFGSRPYWGTCCLSLSTIDVLWIVIAICHSSGLSSRHSSDVFNCACSGWSFIACVAIVMGSSEDGNGSEYSYTDSYYSSSNVSGRASKRVHARPGGMSCREDEDVDFSDGECVTCDKDEEGKAYEHGVPKSPISVKSVLHTEDLGRPRDAEALPPFVDQAPVVAPVVTPQLAQEGHEVTADEQEEELPSFSDGEEGDATAEDKSDGVVLGGAVATAPDDSALPGSAGDYAAGAIQEPEPVHNGPLLGSTPFNEIGGNAGCVANNEGTAGCPAQREDEGGSTEPALQGRITAGIYIPESKRGPWTEEELHKFDISEGKTHLGMAMEGVPLVSGTENKLLCDIGPDIGLVRRKVLAHKRLVRTILHEHEQAFWDQCWMLVWGAKYRRTDDAEVLINHFHEGLTCEKKWVKHCLWKTLAGMMSAVADLSRAWEVMQLYVSSRQCKNAWECILEAVCLPTRRSLAGTTRIMCRSSAAPTAAAATATASAASSSAQQHAPHPQPLSDQAMAANKQKKKEQQQQQQQQLQKRDSAQQTPQIHGQNSKVPPPPPPPSADRAVAKEKAMPAKRQRPAERPSNRAQGNEVVAVDGAIAVEDLDVGVDLAGDDDDVCGIVDLTPPAEQQQALREALATRAGLVGKRARTSSWTRFGLHERLERRCKKVKTPDASAPWCAAPSAVGPGAESDPTYGTTPWSMGVIRPPPPIRPRSANAEKKQTERPVAQGVPPPPPAAAPLMLPPPAAIPMMLPPSAATTAPPLMLPPPSPARKAAFPTTHTSPHFHGGKAMCSTDQRGQSSTSVWRGHGISQSSTQTWHGRGVVDPPSPVRTSMSQVVKTPPPPLSVALAGGGFRRVPSPPKEFRLEFSSMPLRTSVPSHAFPVCRASYSCLWLECALPFSWNLRCCAMTLLAHSPIPHYTQVLGDWYPLGELWPLGPMLCGIVGIGMWIMSINMFPSHFGTWQGTLVTSACDLHDSQLLPCDVDFDSFDLQRVCVSYWVYNSCKLAVDSVYDGDMIDIKLLWNGYSNTAAQHVNACNCVNLLGLRRVCECMCLVADISFPSLPLGCLGHSVFCNAIFGMNCMGYRDICMTCRHQISNSDLESLDLQCVCIEVCAGALTSHSQSHCLCVPDDFGLSDMQHDIGKQICVTPPHLANAYVLAELPSGMKDTQSSGGWQVITPEGYVLGDVPSDGRCLYRSLAEIRGTDWASEYTIIQNALLHPSPELLAAWYDPTRPSDEAQRLSDAQYPGYLAQRAWPGEQAVFAWASATATDVTILTTTGATLRFDHGGDGGTSQECRYFLAYNGCHYRPFLRSDSLSSTSLSVHNRPVVTEHFVADDVLSRSKPRASRKGKTQAGTSAAQMAALFPFPEGWEPEADPSSPTPPPKNLSIAAINVSSLPRHLDTLLDYASLGDGCDVICVSEHMVMENDVIAMKKRLDLAGWHSCFAASPANAQNKPRSGVAILARKGLQLEQTKFEPLQPFYEDGRVVTAWILCGGVPVIHLASLYAPTNPFTMDPDFDTAYWGAVEQWSSYHFGQQLCMAGDFNVEFGQFSEIDCVLAQGHMQNVLDVFTPDRPPTHSGGRAIDHILISENVVPTIMDGKTDLAWRFPNHRLVQVSLRVASLVGGSPKDQGVCLNVPTKLPVSRSVATTLAKLDWEHGKDEFKLAIDQHRIDDALMIWSKRWESASIYSAELNGLDVTRAMTGRAMGELRQQPLLPQVPATSAHLPRGIRRLRRTWSMMKTWLLSQEKSMSFLALAQSQRKEKAILTRTLDLHDMRYEYISAVSIAQLRARLDAELERLKRDRVSAWKAQMADVSSACRFIKGEFITHSAVIEDEQGQTHVGYQAKSEVLREFWQRACVPKGSHTVDSVSAYVRERLDKKPRGERFSIPAFTGEAVRQACRRTRKSSAPGPGSWRVPELLQLGDVAFDELAQLMTLVHETGQTPKDWQMAWVSFIPKIRNTNKVHQQRPITVTPLLWRILARLINTALVENLDKFLLTCQHGARPAHSCTEPALRIRSFGDRLRVQGKDGHLLQLDVAKCFNNLGTWHGLTIMEHYGLDPMTVRLLRNHYSECSVRNKLAPTWASQSYQTLRGCAQGCPISVTVANLILSLVPCTEETGGDDVQTVMFLDDLSIYCEAKDKLAANASRACENLDSLGLSVQPAKCVYVGLGTNSSTESALHVQDMTFEPTDRTQLLGMDIHAQHVDAPHQAQSERACAAKERIERCARIPGSRWHRQNLMSLMVASLWRWGPLDPPISKSYRVAMRRKAWSAVEGCDRPWEEAFEITMGVLLKGHVIDCAWVQAHAAVQMVWQCFHFDETLRVTFEAPVPLPGTMAAELDTLLECVGVKRSGLTLFSSLCDVVVNLGDITPTASSAQIGHEFRALLKAHSLTALAQRRPREFK
eukprot:1758399-Amphidinium_carterae.1